MGFIADQVSTSPDTKEPHPEQAESGPYPTVDELIELTWDDIDREAQARAAWLVLPHPAAIMLGLAVGWQWHGLRDVLASWLDPSATTLTMIAAVAMLAAALGPRVPTLFAMRVAYRLGGRRGRRSVTDDGNEASLNMLRAVQERDLATLWLALAVLTSLAGTAALVTFALTEPVARLHHLLMSRFFWTPLTASLAEWLLVAALTGGLWLLMGLILSSLAAVVGAKTDSRRAPAGVTAGVLIGLGLAWWVHEIWSSRGISAEREFLLGVLPLFALSILAALHSQREEQDPSTSDRPCSDAPELADRAQIWIGLCLFAWGVGGVMVASGWLTCSALRQQDWTARPLWLGAVFVLIGVTVAIASLTGRHRTRSPSGGGMALWGAGAASALIAGLLVYGPTGTWVWIGQLAILPVSLGYALHYAERAWIARAAYGLQGFGQMAGLILAGCAVSLIAVHWWIEPTLGSMGTVAVGVLTMLAAGGLIQIYEEAISDRTLRVRLGVILVSLALATLLFPALVGQWAQTTRQLRDRLARPVPPLEVDTPQPPRRVCLMGVGPTAAIDRLAEHSREIRIFPLIPWSRLGWPRIRRPDSANEHGFAGLGLRRLRLGRERYDVIYQQSPPPGMLTGSYEYTQEWFQGLWTHVRRGGSLIVDIPVEGLPLPAVQVIAATFEAGLETAVEWKVFGDPTPSHLRLRSKRSASSEAPVPTGGTGWRSTGELYRVNGFRPAPHSLRMDRLTARLAPGSEELSLSLQNFLHPGDSATSAARAAPTP